MDSNNIEMYYSDTTDLDAERCECGSIDFEYTNTRVFCVRCGLVIRKSFSSSAGTALESLIKEENNGKVS